MGWETRGGGGRRFYYRKVRRGRKVISEYEGTAESADLTAEYDGYERQIAGQNRRELVAWQARQETADALVWRWCDLVGSLSAAAVGAWGYHRHDRGRWRRRRMANGGELVPLSGKAPGRELVPLGDELRSLVRQAIGGDDEEAEHALRQRLAADPREFKGLATQGAYDEVLAGDAIEAMLDRVAGDDLDTRARIELAMHRMRTELAGPRPTVLEQLLASRIMMTWLQLTLIETTIYSDPDAPRAVQAWYDRRLDGANRRYLQAIKALADVRRLLLPLPAMQVNIAAGGQQQVNNAPNSR